MHRNDFFFPLLCLLKLSDCNLRLRRKKKGRGRDETENMNLTWSAETCLGSRWALLYPEMSPSDKWGLESLYFSASSGLEWFRESMRNSAPSGANRLVFPDRQAVKKAQLCCIHIKYSTDCLALLHLSCISRLFVLMTAPLACQMIRKCFWIS